MAIRKPGLDQAVLADECKGGGDAETKELLKQRIMYQDLGEDGSNRLKTAGRASLGLKEQMMRPRK